MSASTLVHELSKCGNFAVALDERRPRANAVNEASAVAAGVGGRFRVIEVVKDYGNPHAAEDDDEDDE